MPRSTIKADLGWDPADSRDTVELTMPPLDLVEMAKRLRSGSAQSKEFD